jgi:flagellar basal-body rod protein FlgC
MVETYGNIKINMKKLIVALASIITFQVAAEAPYIVPSNGKNGDPLTAASRMAMSGINAQNERMKVVSQNIANMDVTGMTPGGDPYKRKIVFFENTIDPKTGSQVVRVKKVQEDNSDFILKYEPNHPAADESGMVKYPNVNIHIEMADAKEANRAVTVNANSLDMVKSMQFTILDMMKK